MVELATGHYRRVYKTVSIHYNARQAFTSSRVGSVKTDGRSFETAGKMYSGVTETLCIVRDSCKCKNFFRHFSNKEVSIAEPVRNVMRKWIDGVH